MTTEDILKEILRGEPQLSEETIHAATLPGSAIGAKLITLIRNIRLWHTEDAGRGAVLHSIRLVSGLGLRDATPALIDAIFLAYSTRHEEALEDLPIALAQAGQPAIVPLLSIVEDQSLDVTIRSVAASALEGIAVLQPDARDEILSTLRKIISQGPESTALRGHAITIVAHFRLPEDSRLIKHATLAMPLMVDIETDDIDEYFERGEDPDVWSAYRSSLLEYYR